MGSMLSRQTVIAVALWCCLVPCSSSAQSTSTDVKGLIQLSKSPHRAKWYPAVRVLGELAADDPVVRLRVWDLARVDSVGLKFARLDGGQFTMGPYHRRFKFGTVSHPVQISRSFFISVTEVTNEQFGSLFPDYTPRTTFSTTPESPALKITWSEAVEFCRLLSGREGATYRLPTEAEWEYACRGGATTKFSFGATTKQLAKFGWCGNLRGGAADVALLEPNDYGLYDMHGNAAEWVADFYSDSYYKECAEQGVVIDPTGPKMGRTPVVRGAPWSAARSNCSCVARFQVPIFDRVPFESKKNPGFRETLGFRVVREADEPQS